MADSIKIGNLNVTSFKVGFDNCKIYLGTVKLYPTEEYQLCYAVVDNIAQYSDREFEDVYDKATSKWYKLNNNNQYEEYGIYGTGRNITTYEGKLTIDNGNEYEWDGTSWVSLGEISSTTITVKSPEYIGNTGTSIINLGVVLKDTTKFQIKMKPTKAGGGGILSEINAPSDSDDYRIFWASNKLYYDYGDKRINITKLINYTYEYEVGNYYIKNIVNSSNVMSSTTQVGTATSHTRNIGLFKGNDITDVYYLKVYEGDELIRDFIPWTDMNGNYGIYDKVSLQVFRPSTNLSGSTNVRDVVIKGDDVYPLYYTEKSVPLNNLVFNTLEEAESYALNNCVYDGMLATIAGDRYRFDSENGWVIY